MPAPIFRTPTRTKLKELNKQISTLETAFEQKLLAAAKAGALVVDNKADLAGLSDDAIAAAAKAAEARGLKGKWVLPLQNTTQQPSLQSLANRATREKLFNSGWTRAERNDANDTRATISTLAQLRAEKAKLLGYPNYAAYVLEDQMAKTPQAVERFLAQLIPPTAAEARREAKVVQAQIDKDGQAFRPEAVGLESLCRRSAQGQVRSQRRCRSSPISSSTTCSRTASSTPPTSSTA